MLPPRNPQIEFSTYFPYRHPEAINKGLQTRLRAHDDPGTGEELEPHRRGRRSEQSQHLVRPDRDVPGRTAVPAV